MNTHEQAAAAELLQLIKECARLEPEKAMQLASAYKALCEAAAIRQNEKGHRPQ